MYKLLIALFSFFPLFILSLFDGDEVSITMNAPENMEIGQTYQVDLIVNKGKDVQGFGKFEAKIPRGFEVEAIETRGATFTYSSYVMKLLWINLPTDDQFILSYNITPNEKAPKSISLGGKFSFLIDNEKKSFAILPQTITIGGGEVADAGGAAEAAQDVPAEATVTRYFEQVSENQYIVTLTVDKQGIEGFTKIEERVPKGSMVREVETMNSAFSYLRGKVKFVWLSTPADAQFSVKYEINMDAAASVDPGKIIGDYSFLVDNETMKVDVTTSDEPAPTAATPEEAPAEEVAEATEEVPDELVIGGVKINVREATPEEQEELGMNESQPEETPAEETTEPAEDEVAETPTQTEVTPVEEATPPSEPVAEEVTPDPVQEEPSPTPAASDEQSTPPPAQVAQPDPEPTPEPVAQTTETITSTPAPQTGVFYRVQIAAGKNVVDAPYFEKRHNWTQPFVLENHEGWVKYTMGSFDVYRGARDKRNEVTANYNFDGPFVTAYNDGERITVQEALMITKQKWFR